MLVIMQFGFERRGAYLITRLDQRQAFGVNVRASARPTCEALTVPASIPVIAIEGWFAARGTSPSA
nr:Hypothetical protein SC2p1_02180 [Methylocystis sp. SC2]